MKNMTKWSDILNLTRYSYKEEIKLHNFPSHIVGSITFHIALLSHTAAVPEKKFLRRNISLIKFYVEQFADFQISTCSSVCEVGRVPTF